jgi:hypothetical protein
VLQVAAAATENLVQNGAENNSISHAENPTENEEMDTENEAEHSSDA